jgi:hypothetical protein
VRASSRSTAIAWGERSAKVDAIPTARDDLLDQPPLVGGRGVQEVTPQVEEHRAPEADEAGQPLRAAAAGDQAELDLRLPELRVLGGDADVAAHRQLETAAETEAVDRRDERSS